MKVQGETPNVWSRVKIAAGTVVVAGAAALGVDAEAQEVPEPPRTNMLKAPVEFIAKNKFVADGAIVGAGTMAHPPTSSDVKPLQGKGTRGDAREQVFVVAGVLTHPARQLVELQHVQMTYAGQIYGVVNTSHGAVGDMLDAITDKMGALGPAGNTLKQLLVKNALAGIPSRVVAHSQGAIIASNAISAAARDLKGASGSGAAKTFLHGLNVDTFGGASWSYPKGPTYLHMVNSNDDVPQAFGVPTHVSAPDNHGEVNKVPNERPGLVVVNFKEPEPAGIPGVRLRLAQKLNDQGHGLGAYLRELRARFALSEAP